MKLAFLFLIYDSIVHEKLWNRFFENIDPSKYSIYIHYKTNKPLQFFEKYKLTNCIPTEYCKTSIVEAQTLLLKESYKDPLNYKFITLSQSCIPLKSFDHVYLELTKDNMGHFNGTSADMDNELYPRCNSLLDYFDKKNVKKSANWFILNRELTYDMCENINIISRFEKVFCPEEHYFIMIVHLKNKVNQIYQNVSIPENFTTFTNWLYSKEYVFRDISYSSQYKGGLKNYYSIGKAEIDYLLASKCLFGRKFTSSCIVFSRNPKLIISVFDYLIDKI